ncbi:MAG TPA: molybdopterin cofactor-binding domain-containing protein, partial [Conexibacter sp.]|nr:molybdopterin cofactor-binding domain-containing protein [Conexibacter sp.]
ARLLGVDPVEIRRRNLLTPDELPHWTPAMMCLDSGRYGELLDAVAARLDWPRVRAEAARERAQGRLVGAGIASFVEATNFGPSLTAAMMGIANPGHDRAVVRMSATGELTVLTGQMPMGQGLETALAQIAADEIGVPLAQVAVASGDTLACPYTGYGSGGSRGAGVAGSAVMVAAQRLREQLRRHAAHRFALDDVALAADAADAADGAFVAPDGRRLEVAELAAAAYLAADLPPGVEPGLEAAYSYDPRAFAFSYGAVGAVVEIDRDSGAVAVRRLVFGHDCGPQLNPGLVRGQLVGAIAQAIGASFLEQLPYAPDGQPLVRSLWDYFPPLPANVPAVELLHLETPSPFSLNGAKGVGESGVIPVPAALANAVRDALGAADAVVDSLPMTAERVRAAVDRTSAARAAANPH